MIPRDIEILVSGRSILNLAEIDKISFVWWRIIE